MIGITNPAKQLKYLNILVTVAAGLSVIGGVYVLYKNNIWRPKIEIIQVDYDKGIAELEVNGKRKTLYGNYSLFAGADFGIRFGTDPVSNAFTRIDLTRVKSDYIYETIATKTV